MLAQKFATLLVKRVRENEEIPKGKRTFILEAWVPEDPAQIARCAVKIYRLDSHNVLKEHELIFFDHEEEQEEMLWIDWHGFRNKNYSENFREDELEKAVDLISEWFVDQLAA